MTSLKYAALAAIALTLAGCQSVAERRAVDEERCHGYGFRRGTDAFAECLQRIDLDRNANLRSMRDNTSLTLGRYERPRYIVVRERVKPSRR